MGSPVGTLNSYKIYLFLLIDAVGSRVSCCFVRLGFGNKRGGVGENASFLHNLSEGEFMRKGAKILGEDA